MAVAAAEMHALRAPARESEGEKLTACYRSFGGPLRAFLARQTRSVHDAEDLAQEVFLRLWRTDGRTEIRSLKAFVFKTASNLLKDRGRRTHTRMMRNVVPGAEMDLPDLADEPCAIVESLQTLAAFEEVVERLRPSTRAAFLLYRLEACSHAQIAAKLGISVSMVEKHVSCAMAALHAAGVEDREQ
jgi:RNA polymerase sigma factor (sigma-70 family)